MKMLAKEVCTAVLPRVAPGVGLTIALTMLPAAAVAQPEPAAFTDVVEVELVVVDVFVADRDGRPVLDLGREDFRVYQDGQPVEISQFTPAPGGGVAGAEAAGGAGAAVPAATAAAPRRMIIFVDNIHLHPNSRLRVFRTLSRQLASYLEPDDEVMIVTYGGTTEVALPMTRDRGALRRALREQAEPGAVSLLAGYDDERVLHTIAERHFQTLQGSFHDPCTDIGFIAHAHADQVFGRVQSTIAELERFVNSLAGYEGRKMLLHVSDGIPLIAGMEAYRYAAELCDGTGMAKGVPNATDIVVSGAKYSRWDPTRTWANLREFDTADEWTRLAAHANTYQVSFYTFQATLPTHASTGIDHAQTSFDVGFDAKRNDQDALFLLADETGGVAMLESNDIEPALDRLARDSRSGYQLAYEPPHPGDGKQHSIRVEVERPGVEVRHRKSYRSKRSDERVADRVVSALVHGRESNPLSVGVDVTDRQPAGDDLTNVQVRIRIPFERLVLLPEGSSRHGLFTVFVAARNEHGLLTPVGQKTVPLRMPADSREKEFVYTVELPFRGASGDVAVAVHDQIGGEISFLREHVRL